MYVLLTLILSLSWAGAQDVPRDYRFEVASIKRGDPSGRMSGPPGGPTPGRFHAESVSIASLAMRAFGAKQSFQIDYQRWMNSAYFNVDAKFPDDATQADLPVMIRHLLEDRFGLVFHREVRKMAGYELSLTKSGPKLTKAAARATSGKDGGDIEVKNGVPQFSKDAGSGKLIVAATMTAILRGRGRTIAGLADDLAQELGVPVADATGIKGEYDYDLTYTPEPKGLSAAPIPRDDAPQLHPPLRDALKAQLGLTLQPVKDVPVTVVVLDSAKKDPVEN